MDIYNSCDTYIRQGKKIFSSLGLVGLYFILKLFGGIFSNSLSTVCLVSLDKQSEFRTNCTSTQVDAS